jgi:3-dehydro-L-gulonate-6-phosphate decarboxylase
MNSTPLIQLALDYVSLPPALAVAQLLRDEVEAIEIGTPLCKAEGMRAVATVRELCPNNIILADVKSPDVGGLEAKICFDAGADWMTVLGAAPLETVQLALKEAQSRPGKEAFIELTGIRDIIARAREWRAIGIERMVYHRGWDEGNISRTWDASDRATIEQLINMGFKISVAGGLELETIEFFRGVDIKVFIIGRAIREAPDPVASARRFRALINQLWGGGVSAGNAAEELASKAVRWAVSEMGLLLTVDGRECPGCDSPGRFCFGPRTEIQVPAGVNVQELVSRIATMLDPAGGQAVGWASPGSFYLDLRGLPRLNDAAVIGLLSTTGSTLNALGYAADTVAALSVAQRILGERS